MEVIILYTCIDIILYMYILYSLRHTHVVDVYNNNNNNNMKRENGLGASQSDRNKGPSESESSLMNCDSN